MCFISIIIPTFNSAKTISNCLNSILLQSFTNYEVLIQDSCSTDNTLAIVSSYNDPRIKVVSDKDLGVYDAMNKAISRSQGDWLYFLGSDDSLYNSNVLESVSKHLLITEAVVVYGDVKLIGEGGVLKGDENGLYRGITPTEELFTHNICHQAIFYKSIDIKNNNFQYELKYPIQADHMFNIKMASQFTFEYIPIVVANFQHGGISSQVTDFNFASDIGKVLLDYYGKALADKKFYRYKSIIKKTAKKQLKKGNIISSFKGYIIYFKLKYG